MLSVELSHGFGPFDLFSPCVTQIKRIKQKKTHTHIQNQKPKKNEKVSARIIKEGRCAQTIKCDAHDSVNEMRPHTLR